MRKDHQPNKGNFGYDAIKDDYVDDLVRSGVIDPLKVTRSALEHASSAAATLLTTEVAIAEEPKEEKAEMPGGGGGMEY